MAKKRETVRLRLMAGQTTEDAPTPKRFIICLLSRCNRSFSTGCVEHSCSTMETTSTTLRPAWIGRGCGVRDPQRSVSTLRRTESGADKKARLQATCGISQDAPRLSWCANAGGVRRPPPARGCCLPLLLWEPEACAVFCQQHIEESAQFEGESYEYLQSVSLKIRTSYELRFDSCYLLLRWKARSKRSGCGSLPEGEPGTAIAFHWRSSTSPAVPVSAPLPFVGASGSRG